MKERLGKPLIDPKPEHAGGTIYRDVDGTVISESDFDKKQAAIKKKAKASLKESDARAAQLDKDFAEENKG